MSLILLFILGLVGLTSVLSGVLGMGGGLILMGGLAVFLPVPAAMVVHGVAQLTANGSRALIHREHVRRSVLKPYLDSGKLVVRSKQMGMDKVGTLRWDGAVAQARMDNILSANYSDGSVVHGVLAPYDGLSRGIISSLRGVGYGSAEQPWPIVTGQDAEAPSVKAIIAGEQYSTVYKDTRELAKVTADLVDTIVSGGTPEGLDTKTYDNGVKVVPSVLLTPYSVDATNYKEMVIDSGYLKPEDIQ